MLILYGYTFKRLQFFEGCGLDFHTKQVLPKTNQQEG
jgi:hypothetical protein